MLFFFLFLKSKPFWIANSRARKKMLFFSPCFTLRVYTVLGMSITCLAQPFPPVACSQSHGCTSLLASAAAQLVSQPGLAPVFYQSLKPSAFFLKQPLLAWPGQHLVSLPGLLPAKQAPGRLWQSHGSLCSLQAQLILLEKSASPSLFLL